MSMYMNGQYFKITHPPRSFFVEGNPVIFKTKYKLPIKSLKVNFNPIQDLNGYDHPWPGGAEKNLLGLTINLPATWQNLTLSALTDGIIEINGTYSSPNARAVILADDVTLQSGKYILSGSSTDLYQQAGMRLQLLRKSDASVLGYDRGNGLRFTLEEETTLRVRIHAIATTTPIDIDGAVIKPMIRRASETDDTFAPYSNVCSISGWTGCNINHSGADVSDPTTIPISWADEAGTVYGGYLEWLRDGTVRLTKTHENVDMGTLDYTWIENATIKGGGSFRANIASRLPHTIYGKMLCSDYYITPITGISNLPAGSDMLIITTNNSNDKKIYVLDSRYTDADSFKSAVSGVQLVYTLATPVTYTLTPQEALTLLQGTNTISSNSNGNIEIIYESYTNEQ